MYVSIEKKLTSFIGTKQAVEREDVETEQVPVKNSNKTFLYYKTQQSKEGKISNSSTNELNILNYKNKKQEKPFELKHEIGSLDEAEGKDSQCEGNEGEGFAIRL